MNLYNTKFSLFVPPTDSNIDYEDPKNIIKHKIQDDIDIYYTVSLGEISKLKYKGIYIRPYRYYIDYINNSNNIAIMVKVRYNNEYSTTCTDISSPDINIKYKCIVNSGNTLVVGKVYVITLPTISFIIGLPYIIITNNTKIYNIDGSNIPSNILNLFHYTKNLL